MAINYDVTFKYYLYYQPRKQSPQLYVCIGLLVTDRFSNNLKKISVCFCTCVYCTTKCAFLNLAKPPKPPSSLQLWHVVCMYFDHCIGSTRAPLSIHLAVIPTRSQTIKKQKPQLAHSMPTRTQHDARYKVDSQQFWVDLNVQNDPGCCQPKWQLFRNQSDPFLPAQAVPHQDTQLSQLRMDWISDLLLPSQTKSLCAVNKLPKHKCMTRRTR